MGGWADSLTEASVALGVLAACSPPLANEVATAHTPLPLSPTSSLAVIAGAVPMKTLEWSRDKWPEDLFMVLHKKRVVCCLNLKLVLVISVTLICGKGPSF